MHVGARDARELRNSIKTAISIIYIILKFWTHNFVYKLLSDYMSFCDLSKKIINSSACMWAAISLDEI